MPTAFDSSGDAASAVTRFGKSGDEAIHGILDMMSADQSVEALRWAVPIHPTVSELIPTLLLDLAPVE